MGILRGPGIYIRHDGEKYYVGQSKDVVNRGAHHTERLLAAFPASEDKHKRRIAEAEMIQFMEAAGVPLANIHQDTGGEVKEGGVQVIETLLG